MSATTTTTSSHRPRKYIGDSDQDILAFISNLAKQMQAPPLGFGPEAFGLDENDAAIISAAADAYQLAYRKAHDPVTRTVTAIVIKDQTRDEADRIARRYAQIIKNMPADRVSDVLKFSAGVPVPGARKRRKSHLPAPQSFPRLYLDADRTAQGLSQLVRSVWLQFRDSSPGMLNDSRRMPREASVTHMILRAEIVTFGHAPPTWSLEAAVHDEGVFVAGGGLCDAEPVSGEVGCIAAGAVRD